MLRFIALSLMCTIFLISTPFTTYADTNLGPLFDRLEKEADIPAGILGRIAKAETGNCSARATAGSLSSAAGLFQWLKSSWLSFAPRVDKNYGDPNLRFEPAIAAHVTAWWLKHIQNSNGALIQQANIDMTLGIYMGHFLGVGGARSFLNAYIRDPNANAAALFPKQARSNPAVFRNGSLRNVLQYFASKLSSSCTTVTQYTTALNDGPIGTNAADRALETTTPYPVGPAIYQDPERDYVDTYPPPVYQAPSAPAPSASTQYPGLISQPNTQPSTPPALPKPVPLSPTPSSVNSSDIFTPTTNTPSGTGANNQTSGQTGTNTNNTTEPDVTVSVFDQLNEIAFGTSTTVGTPTGTTSIIITPVITSSAQQLAPQTIRPTDIATQPTIQPTNPTTFGTDSAYAQNAAQPSVLQTFAAILQDARAILERMLSLLQ